MFETLFGGALVIIVLYFLLRAFGVSNYWRGVISGVVPVIGYLGLSTANWPGGDVISMHMAVYLATATVLTVVGARQRGEAKRLHWGPKLIIGFFLVLFVIDGTLLVVSGQGVPQAVAKWMLPPAKKTSHAAHTAFSGVVPHGEEAAKSINQFLANSDKQQKLGWDVSVTGMEKIVQGHRSSVTLTARGADAQPLRGAVAAMALLRPGMAQPEQILDLAEAEPGVYRADIAVAQSGLWLVAIRVQRAGDRFEMQQELDIPASR
jgi:nitrogen fixation protein FixH